MGSLHLTKHNLRGRAISFSAVAPVPGPWPLGPWFTLIAVCCLLRGACSLLLWLLLLMLLVDAVVVALLFYCNFLGRMLPFVSVCIAM